jgi:hypothetical protein
MEIKKQNKNEIKLEKLTLLRISVVLFFEFLFEFSFGIFFYIFTQDQSYYGDDCQTLLFWANILWMVYFAEFSIAFICFIIGFISLLCCTILLKKVYVGFNNFFKSLIFIISIALLGIITVVYNMDEKCNQLRDLTFIWMLFQYILLGLAVLACCIILIITCIVYIKNRKIIEADEITNRLIESDNEI